MGHLRVEQLAVRDLPPVDLSIPAGACYCLSGPSGAGKTVLLRAIADLDPHQGEIYLDDQACSAMPAPQWRRRVALLAAESQWWRPLVGDHFVDGNAAWLERLGFGAEVMGWSVERLSTGERQRLALLRLVANQPEALLLDEPTANLDPEATAVVEGLIAEYREEHRAAVVWVSHDPAQRRRVADRQFRLISGALTEVEP